MTVWEYKVIEGSSAIGGTFTGKNLTEELNKQGNEGWELILITFDSFEQPLTIFFKRPMPMKE